MLRWISSVEGALAAQISFAEGALVAPPLEVSMEWQIQIAQTVGRWRKNICKKCITTNENLHASSSELLILARVENTKRRAGTKVIKT